MVSAPTGPTGPGKTVETFEQLTAIYLADELMIRARRMAKDFPFLLENEDFKNSIEAFKDAYKNSPESTEEVRALHGNLIVTLQELEGPTYGADIISIQPNGSQPVVTRFEIPEEIRDFDSMVSRVCESTEDGILEDSIGSAAEKIILGEATLEEFQLQYQLKIRRRIYEMINEVEVYYDGDDEELEDEEISATEVENDNNDLIVVEDITTEELVARVDRDEFLQLLSLSEDELEDRVEEYSAQLVDQIKETRDLIEDCCISGGAETTQGREEEATRIMYEKTTPAVSNIIPGVRLAVIDNILRKNLTSQEEAALRMIYGEPIDFEAVISSKVIDKTPQATRNRVEIIEAEALRSLGVKPPTGPSGKNPEGPKELPSGVASFADHKKRKDDELAQAAGDQASKKATK